ncbi:MAG TPA: VWA domain-containing protein [Candidatus Acidoferrum sp.]|nr:VWA domain-containing protein [Candidatus Acidoferrum sp.]
MPAAGQNPPAQKDPLEIAKQCNCLPLVVDLTALNVTVLDERRNPIEGLRLHAFQIKEDGYEQKVAYLKQSDDPISVGLVVSRSGASVENDRMVNDAAIQFLQNADPRDEYFLIDSNRAQEFVSEPESIKQRLNEPTPNGTAALSDELYAGLSKMRDAHNRWKVLFVATDDQFRSGEHGFADVRNLIFHSGTQIYAVVIPDAQHLRAGDTANTITYGLLKTLCNLSGGEDYLAFDSNISLPSVMNRISAILRSQYELGYFSTNAAHDGKWRSVKVKVDVPRASRPAQVLVQSGYFAPKPYK